MLESTEQSLLPAGVAAIPSSAIAAITTLFIVPFIETRVEWEVRIMLKLRWRRDVWIAGFRYCFPIDRFTPPLE
jgi:hypothetical protein